MFPAAPVTVTVRGAREGAETVLTRPSCPRTPAENSPARRRART